MNQKKESKKERNESTERKKKDYTIKIDNKLNLINNDVFFFKVWNSFYWVKNVYIAS